MTWSGYVFSGLLSGSLLELVGGRVAQGGVESGAVVPGDVLHDRASGASPGGPGLGVETLALEGGEERFGQGVVPALTGAADRQPDVAVAGQVGELGRGVLGAPVGVED